MRRPTRPSFPQLEATLMKETGARFPRGLASSEARNFGEVRRP